jgi:hypothetical protein
MSEKDPYAEKRKNEVGIRNDTSMNREREIQQGGNMGKNKNTGLKEDSEDIEGEETEQ